MEIKDILERIALPARSNKHGFTNIEKLEAINNLIEESDSPFHLVRKTPNAWIYGQRPVSTNDNAVLITSHADIVDNMTEPSSTLIEEGENKGHFKGTYDNLGTNGVCVSLMINHDMPQNVYFSFTAEEESGRNTGARDSLEYIRGTSGRQPICMALDVTYEGYDENVLFTLEGAHGLTEKLRQEFIKEALKTEGEKRAFQVVPLKSKHDNSFLPKLYIVKDTSDPDESIFFAKANCNSCSICLPGDGVMHGNSGFYIKEPVMKGYEVSLAALIYQYTQTFPDKLEEIKDLKDKYVKKAKEIKEREAPKTTYSSSVLTGYSSSSDIRNGMTEEEWEDYVSFNASFNVHDEEYDTYETYMRDLADEMAYNYSPNEFDEYYEETIREFGLEGDEDIKEWLAGIFADVQNAIEESKDYDYDDYE